MKLLKYVAIILFLCSISSCNNSKYKSDIHLLGSAQANSPEFLIRINGNPCKNGQGEIGLCIMGVKRNRALSFSLNILPYDYDLEIICSSNVDVEFNTTVFQGDTFSYTVSPDRFSHVTVFNCQISVYPHEHVNAMFASMRFFVVAEDYKSMDTPYTTTRRGKTYLVTGSHARFIYLNDVRVEEKTTEIEYNGEQVVIESESGRRAYYGF